MPQAPRQGGEAAVRYGGWMFSAPAAFTRAVPPSCAGVYAIQVVNPTWTPVPFEPIYFGAAENLAEGTVTPAHRAFGRWIAHPRAGTGLFVSYAAMPCTSSEVLARITLGLIAAYRPAANEGDGSPTGLPGRVG
jgi:hypothetical protein